VNTWKAILAALVIFGAGFVTGTALNRLADESKAIAPPAMPAAATRNAARSSQMPIPMVQLRKIELMGRVQKALDLTADQHARIEKIIGDGQDQIQDLWNQVAPDIQDEFEDVKKKVCAQLTPEQETRFNMMMKQQLLLHARPGATNAPPQGVPEQK
jgi:Spy/CpxP family protein refolding chaperone